MKDWPLDFEWDGPIQFWMAHHLSLIVAHLVAKILLTLPLCFLLYLSFQLHSPTCFDSSYSFQISINFFMLSEDDNFSNKSFSNRSNFFSGMNSIFLQMSEVVS